MKEPSSDHSALVPMKGGGGSVQQDHDRSCSGWRPVCGAVSYVRTGNVVCKAKKARILCSNGTLIWFAENGYLAADLRFPGIPAWRRLCNGLPRRGRSFQAEYTLVYYIIMDSTPCCTSRSLAGLIAHARAGISRNHPGILMHSEHMAVAWSHADRHAPFEREKIREGNCFSPRTARRSA